MLASVANAIAAIERLRPRNQLRASAVIEERPTGVERLLLESRADAQDIVSGQILNTVAVVDITLDGLVACLAIAVTAGIEVAEVADLDVGESGRRGEGEGEAREEGRNMHAGELVEL